MLTFKQFFAEPCSLEVLGARRVQWARHEREQAEGRYADTAFARAALHQPSFTGAQTKRPKLGLRFAA